MGAAYFTNLWASEIETKYKKRVKYLPILYESPCDNFYLQYSKTYLKISEFCRTIFLTFCILEIKSLGKRAGKKIKQN